MRKQEHCCKGLAVVSYQDSVFRAVLNLDMARISTAGHYFSLLGQALLHRAYAFREGRNWRIFATKSMVLENEQVDFRTGKSGTLKFGSSLGRMVDQRVDDKIPLVPRSLRWMDEHG